MTPTPVEANGTRIDMGPASFVDEPTLAATVAHERQHVQQLRESRTPSTASLSQLEKEAYGVEARRSGDYKVAGDERAPIHRR